MGGRLMHPDNMYSVYQEFEKCVPMVLLAESGSRAYGTHRPDSDYDYKGVYMLPAAEMLSLGGGSQTHQLGSIDATAYELLHFCKLAAAANPTVLETLWSRNWMTNTILGRRLYDSRELFLSKRVAKTYGGYALSQVQKARAGTGGSRGVEHFKREKFRLHTLRLVWAGIHVLRHGEVMVRMNDSLVRTLREYSQMDDGVFEATVKDGIATLNEAAALSPLPDEPDVEGINTLMAQMRGLS